MIIRPSLLAIFLVLDDLLGKIAETRILVSPFKGRKFIRTPVPKFISHFQKIDIS